MAGIYLHIPFCRKACTYCNFHFSTSLNLKTEMLAAIHAEIALQKDYLKGAAIDSVYFGGGTPSVLLIEEINAIFEQLKRFHTIKETAEITLEANPDDLDFEYLKNLKSQTPINRLSIGIQSFVQADLELMNRSHNSKQAISAIENAKKAGFQNLSIDLIYGTPTLSHKDWEKNLQVIFDLKIPHISCYALTVEPKTALAYKIEKEQLPPVEEIHTAEQFDILKMEMTKNGYHHYEISNFALPNMYAKHNSAYWKTQIYLGLGPSAHSFNIFSRQWNVANNAQYIKALKRGELPNSKELLSKTDQFNEAIMTGLRTMWGIDIEELGKKFDITYCAHLAKEVKPFLKSGLLEESDSCWKLTPKGQILADSVMSQLFYCD